MQIQFSFRPRVAYRSGDEALFNLKLKERDNYRTMPVAITSLCLLDWLLLAKALYFSVNPQSTYFVLYKLSIISLLL